MKKIYVLFVCASVFGQFVFGQSRVTMEKAKSDLATQADFKPLSGISAPSLEQVDVSYPVMGGEHQDAIYDYIIGSTEYDLQSNQSLGNRVYYFSDGTIGAVWTMGLDFPNFNLRGTGYNYYDGTAWDPEPTARIESVKTGWPSIAPLGSNGEIIVAHNGLASVNGGLVFSRRAQKGTGTWTESLFQGPDPDWHELLWPRMVTNGTDHSIIHLLATTAPTVNGGNIYQGQDPALLYNRSQDGGQTWDRLHVILPGTGAAYYTAINADEYTWAEPVGNTIAWVCTDSWHDWFIMKSIDNGDTWTKIMVWEHPYPFFDWNYTLTTDTLWAPDGSADIALDNSGRVHTVCGLTRVAHTEVGTNYTWWPNTDGIAYWNENRPPFTAPNQHDALDAIDVLIPDYNLIGWTQDVNNNGIIELESQILTYRTPGLSTMPNITIDDQNRIFLVYSSATETYTNGTYNFRHIWARGSKDNGATWGDFLDLNSDIIYIFDECIYPVLAGKSDNKIHLVFNRDATPGLALDGDHAYQQNSQIYMSVAKSDLINYQSQQGISIFPYSMSFEAGLGEWVQSSDDNFDWTVYSGPTPTVNTGPDLAYEGAYYVYTESSSPNYPGKTAGLYAKFDFSLLLQPALSFWYHLYGMTMGILKVQVSTNGGNSWTDLWTKSGDQGNQWFNDNVSLSAYSGMSSVLIRFYGITGSSFYSDMAVDYIQVTGIQLPPLCTGPVTPIDGGTGVSVSTNLKWLSSAGATGYRIYFGTDNPPTNIENGTDLGNSLLYNPSPDLNYLTVYYWRIAPYNAGGPATGCPVWSFTTQSNPYVPPSCSTPVLPADGASGVSIATLLQWSIVTEATGYLLYFGTDNPPANIVNGEDLGNVQLYDHPIDLDYMTQYFWKIVPYNPYGQATGCPVWSFTTENMPALPPLNLQATIENTNDVVLTWTAPVVAPGILLVDRDGSTTVYTDCAPMFKAALEDNGITDYGYYEVTDLTLNGPDLATMQQYDIIIWFTGEAWGYYGDDCMTPTDEQNVALFLQGGGRFLMSSMDYLYASYPNAGILSPGTFPYDYLGLRIVIQDTWSIMSPATATAQGIAGSCGQGFTFTLQDIFSAKDGLYIDQVTQTAGQQLFNVTSPSPAGSCATQYAAGNFKTIFTTADFAAITDPATRKDLMMAMINWLNPSEKSKSLLGYNVYRNNVKINTSLVTGTTYADNNVPYGMYAYYVTAVYDQVESDPSNTVTVEIIATNQVHLKAFLEGPFSSGYMGFALNVYGYLPYVQPYGVAPWYYEGTEQVTQVPDFVVDWVLIELRETTGGASTAVCDSVVARQAGFILYDGSIVGLDGSSDLVFILNISANLYAVVYQRNHLAIMSAQPVVLSGGIYSYDFTIGSGQIYGGSLGSKQLMPGMWGMIAGDGDASNQVNNVDKNDVWRPQSGNSGYLKGDFDMNGQVNNVDKNDYWRYNSGKSSQVPLTGCNDAPYPPFNPLPADGSASQPLNTQLSWTCSDPENDPLTYDVYFGTSSPPALVSAGQAATVYNPGLLAYGTVYYWKVVAHDDHGNTTEGPVWTFSTLSPSPEWIHWDDGINASCIGLTSGGTFYVASRWLPADLSQYNGQYISKIKFFHFEDTGATFVLYVWKGVNAGTQLMMQPVTSTVVGDWNEVTLTTPVQIDATQELWFGYKVTHGTGTFPAGTDAGPAVAYKGDMISLNGTTWESMSVFYSLDYNWNLHALVSPVDGGLEPAQPMVRSMEQLLNKGMPAVKPGK